jgi:UDP-2,3-diacylglucosamine pyrophosphatase LpxH
VVSDLHLGGEAPFQIFAQGEALAATIRGLISADSPTRRRAFVINGDFVDFLAESPASLFDPQGAVKKLQRIASDPAFSDVFTALSQFIKVPGYRLGIILGNHDLELALPWVRQALLKILVDEDEAAMGRILWSLDGQGLLFRMGNKGGPKVLCLHGNEVDGWNVADHEALRRIGREGQRANTPQADYAPNAGSRMVVEVMNSIKKRFPFVDLLKPETQAVVPILLTLDPKAASALRKLPAIAAKEKWAETQIELGFLGDTPGQETPAYPGSDDFHAPSAPRALRSLERDRQREDLMNRVEENFRDGICPSELQGADSLETLGLGSAIWTLMTTGDKVEALRAQLSDLITDDSFLLTQEDETYRKMDQRVSKEIDFLVTGHTHLARAIERETGCAYYFNTGTWARVFRISEASLNSSAQFKNLYSKLASPYIASLDSASELVKVPPHLAAIWVESNVCYGELREVSASTDFRLQTVSGTTFTRS